MTMLCKLGHKPEPGQTWNDGYYFSRCCRCRRDLVRAADGRWQSVPRGYKVVWKPRGRWDIDWSAWAAANRGTHLSA